MKEDVKKVFEAYPEDHRQKMLALRELILQLASSIDGVGELDETLKWGEPAYLTTSSKSGTTIRIDWKQKSPEFYSVFFHCQTNLVDRFRKQFPTTFQFEGNRALLISVDQPLPIQELSECFSAALTYHWTKKEG